MEPSLEFVWYSNDKIIIKSGVNYYAKPGDLSMSLIDRSSSINKFKK